MNQAFRPFLTGLFAVGALLGVCFSAPAAENASVQQAALATEKNANATGAALPSPQIKQLRIAGTQTKVRAVFDLPSEIDYRVWMVGNPIRVVIDFPKADLQLNEDIVKGSPGFLHKVHYGKVSAGSSRVILTSHVPVKIADEFVLPAENGQPSRLVFDFETTTKQDFEDTIVRRKLEAKAEVRREKLAAQELARKRAEQKAAKENSKKRKLVVIDPGHGGIDPGAQKHGVTEKKVVLKFAKKLQKELSKNRNIEVVLTREDDTFILLDERREIARRLNADLFISIHADSFPADKSIRGAAIYTLSEHASNAVAAAIAKQENKADAIAGLKLDDTPEDVFNILLDLTKRETNNLSIEFARHLVKEMRPKMRFFKNPLQSANFRVLKAPDIPSVLIELGFLSNQADAKLLASDKQSQKNAVNLARSIKSYLDVANLASNR